MGEVIGEGLPPDVLRRAFRDKENLRDVADRARSHQIDLGRQALIDSHWVLARYGSDPKVIRRYEKSYAELERILAPDELDEARTLAFEFILNEESRR